MVISLSSFGASYKKIQLSCSNTSLLFSIPFFNPKLSPAISSSQV